MSAIWIFGVSAFGLLAIALTAFIESNARAGQAVDRLLRRVFGEYE